MKASFILSTLLGGLLAFSNAQAGTLAEPVLLVFGVNSGVNTEYVTGKYLDETKTWNKLSTSKTDGYSYTDIQGGNGQVVSGLSVQLNDPNCGDGGRIDTITGNEILGQYIDYAGENKIVDACANKIGGTQITFSGLKAGTYTLQILAGRGNQYGGTDVTTYGITGGGVGNVSASVLTSSNTSSIAAPSVSADGTEISASTYSSTANDKTADNWALMQFTFTVGDEGTFTINSSGSGGNIAAVMLVPEPATVSLGFLGVLPLLMRRRRK